MSEGENAEKYHRRGSHGPHDTGLPRTLNFILRMMRRFWMRVGKKHELHLCFKRIPLPAIWRTDYGGKR